MPVVGKIVTRARLDTKQWKSGMRRINKSLTNFVSGAKRAGLAAAAGIAAAVAMVKKYADSADEVAKQARRTGFGAVELGGLAHAADLAGASMGDIEKGSRKLAQTIYFAGKGMKTYKDALADIGLTYDELKGLAPDEQFMRVSKALAGVQDKSKRIALAAQIFGRSGTRLLPMINQGADALQRQVDEGKQLIGLSAEQYKQAERIKDQWSRASLSIKGIVIQIGAALAPYLDKVLEKIISWGKGFKYVLASVKLVWQDIKAGWILVKAVVEKFFIDIMGGTKIIAGEITGLWQIAVARIRRLFAVVFDWLTKQWNKIAAKINKVMPKRYKLAYWAIDTAPDGVKQAKAAHAARMKAINAEVAARVRAHRKEVAKQIEDVRRAKGKIIADLTAVPGKKKGAGAKTPAAAENIASAVQSRLAAVALKNTQAAYSMVARFQSNAPRRTQEQIEQNTSTLAELQRQGLEVLRQIGDSLNRVFVPGDRAI